MKPKFIKLPVLLYFLLVVITLGLYDIYWLLFQGNALRKISKRNLLPEYMLYGVALLALVDGFITIWLLIIDIVYEAGIPYSLSERYAFFYVISEATLYIFMLLFLFIGVSGRQILHEYMEDNEIKDVGRIPFIAVLFFSILAVQYKINQLIRKGHFTTLK